MQQYILINLFAAVRHDDFHRQWISSHPIPSSGAPPWPLPLYPGKLGGEEPGRKHVSQVVNLQPSTFFLHSPPSIRGQTKSTIRVELCSLTLSPNDATPTPSLGLLRIQQLTISNIPWMIGLHCLQPPARVVGAISSDGRLWRCFGRTTMTTAQNRASNVSSCDCCRIIWFHIILGVLESSTRLQIHVEAAASISFGHGPKAMNPLFHSFFPLLSYVYDTFVITVADSRLRRARVTAVAFVFTVSCCRVVHSSLLRFSYCSQHTSRKTTIASFFVASS